jgi:hypothetical protein
MRNKGNQDITRWASQGKNRYGEDTFAAPVVVKGRWEDRNEEVQTLRGETIISRSIVYLQEGVEIGDYLALGDYSAVSDPELASALEVQAKFTIPSLRTNRSEHRAVL